MSRRIIDTPDLDGEEEDLSLVAFKEPDGPPIKTFGELKRAIWSPLFLAKSPVGDRYRHALRRRLKQGCPNNTYSP